MKNNLILILLLLLFFNSFSQIPNHYYDNTNGLSGEELKSTLNIIIKSHIEYPYTSISTDTWDILKISDRDPNNSDNVILFYSGWSVNANQEWNNGNGWSREHIWSKSHGDFGTTKGAGTDAHHLRPCDPSINSAKNNRWFDNCDIPYIDDGINTECYTSDDEWVWEPRNEVKGDVARMIFYMATRYESSNLDLEIVDYLPYDTSLPLYAKLSTLLKWHKDDPVDDFERNRNNVIYDFQQNRNPFIDKPEFVNLIWKCLDNVNKINIDDIKLYPLPTTDFLFIQSKINIDNIKLYNSLGIEQNIKINYISNNKIRIKLDCDTGAYILIINKNIKKNIIKL